MRARLVSLAVLTLACARGAPTLSPAGGRTSAAITPEDLSLRLYAIAADSMMGREPGTDGNYKTADYVASEFRRLGLMPGGEGGTFFQTVPFFRQTPDEHSTLRVDDIAFRLGADFLPAGLPTRPRPIDGVEVVFGGEVQDSSTWIPASEASGRLVLLSNLPGLDRQRRYVFLSVPARNPRFTAAAALAVAQLDLLPPERVAQVRNGFLVTDSSREDLVPPQLLLTPRAAEILLGRPLAGAVPGFRGRTVHGAFDSPRVPVAYRARNVIAILPGSDPRLHGEYVSLTAHNDHVGFGHQPVDHDSIRAFNRVVRPMGADSPERAATADEGTRIRIILDSLRRVHRARPDSIYNGADDDGTGTVSILEIAEALASAPDRPRRSILFVSHTGEESGLIGSGWFTDHPTVPIDSIVGEIDQDMVGRGTAADLPEGGPTYLEVIGARRLSNEFGDLLEAANAAQPTPFVFNYAYDVPGHPLQYYCRADHYNYARYGIPSVALSRGEHLDYHQVTDEPQYIDYPDMARVARMVRDVALRIANADRRPALDHPKGDPHTPCRQ